MRYLFGLLMLTTGLSACSQKSIYEAAQNSRLNECNTLQGELYEQCLEENSMSYEEYQRERNGEHKQE